MIHLAVIGYGYWGPNLVRNFNEAEECRAVACCDLDSQRLSRANRSHGRARRGNGLACDAAHAPSKLVQSAAKGTSHASRADDGYCLRHPLC